MIESSVPVKSSYEDRYWYPRAVMSPESVMSRLFGLTPLRAFDVTAPKNMYDST